MYELRWIVEGGSKAGVPTPIKYRGLSSGSK
jgi:hypothetical protein